ncbi:hypothetical protein BFW01_g2735 [Lasiodiplodia theobromae]|nr:hypothetical protein BFW01_g2735 [Lasiodiplodia theobromae]
MSHSGMKLRSGLVKAADDIIAPRKDKSRVTKRTPPAPRTPLAAAEQTFVSKFRWTEKRDKTLLIHLIGLGGAITDEEYAKLATLWEGATADDVHARVEFLRAQQILTVRTEETAEAAAEADPESAWADNVDQSANVEEPVSSETSSPLSSPLSLASEAPSPPPPSSPASLSSSSSAASDDEGDDDNDDDEAQPALKPALKSRTSTTAVPGGKSVRFASPFIATKSTIPRMGKGSYVDDMKRGHQWVPVATAQWEEEMFDAEDAAFSASASASPRRRKRSANAAADDDELARPAKRSRSSSTTTAAADDDDSSSSNGSDNPDYEEEEEVPYPLSQTARSPRVPRTRAGSPFTASNIRFADDDPSDFPRSFPNKYATFPKPARVIAAIAEGEDWQEESEDEGETAVIAGDVSFEMREEYTPNVRFTTVPHSPPRVVPDEGWSEPYAKDRGGEWESDEGEGESEEESLAEFGDEGAVVEEAEEEEEEAPWQVFQPAQPLYDQTHGFSGYQQVEGSSDAAFYGDQFMNVNYGAAGGWYLEASQEEFVDDGSAGQQYYYPPPPVDDGGNTPYPGLGSAPPASVGEEEVAEHPLQEQQQQYEEEPREEEESDADDVDDWTYFNQFDNGSVSPTNPTWGQWHR